MTTPSVSITTRTTDLQGEHVQVSVWAGPLGQTRGLCGVLIMRPEEARELVERIGRGEVLS